MLNTDVHITRNSIKRAVENNSIYKNYRWMFINRDTDIKEINVEPTNIEKEVKCFGYISKLNDDKTEIINVYYSMQQAILENGNISRNSEYYILYKECKKELLENFERINGKPLLYKNGIGQFDENDNLINEFSSKENCFRNSNISRALLSKLIKEKINHNGFTYKYIGKKTRVIT